jgi:serine-type D-Ala-D-Ala endopeptidase (penicillin-binding protein 7)
MSMNFKHITKFCLIIFVFFFSFSITRAESDLVLIEETYVNNNLEISFFSDEFKLFFPTSSLNKETKVVAKKILAPFDWPWNFSPLTDVYEFDLENRGESYNREKPINIKIYYGEDKPYYKNLYFFDSNANLWRELPSRDNFKEAYVEAKIHFSYSRLAILYNDKVDLEGEASWYSFRNGNFAASADFPRGSKIRVYNLENDKYIDVTINDYGPDRKVFPNRIIDLDKIAFNQIASPGAGLINIRLEPLHIAKASNDFVFSAGPNILNINASSAILMSENEGQVIFAKEPNIVAPLASLTKLVAVKVFLDLGISLDREVVYIEEDEKFNHQFVAPWESARLRVNPGEVLTVKDLIYSSLVGSANNTMETLVRVSGLNRQEFMARMNIFSEVWGARQTKFVEPTGLSKDNVSTPQDYAIIMRELLKDPLISDISTTHIYSFTTVNTKRGFRLSNTNQLMRYGLLEINAAKTGFINASGYCLFSRVKNGDDNLIVVSFNSNSRDLSYNDHERLIYYALKQEK